MTNKRTNNVFMKIALLAVLLTIPLDATSNEKGAEIGVIDYDGIINNSKLDRKLAVKRSTFRQLRQQTILKFKKAIVKLEERLRSSSGPIAKERLRALALKEKELKDYKRRYNKEFSELGFEYMLREYKRIDQVAARLSLSGRYSIIYKTQGLRRQITGEAWVDGKKVKIRNVKLPVNCKNLSEKVIEYLTRDKYRPKLY